MSPLAQNSQAAENSLTSKQALARREWNHHRTRHWLKFQVQPNYCQSKEDFSLLLTHFSPSSNNPIPLQHFLCVFCSKPGTSTFSWGIALRQDQSNLPPLLLLGKSRSKGRREFPALKTRRRSLQHRESSVSSSPQTPQKSIPQECGSPLQGNSLLYTRNQPTNSLLCLLCSPKNAFNIQKLPPV